MIWVDYCILAVFAVSALVGILRGFTREVLGIFTWVFAGWLAWAFADDFAPALEPRIDQPGLRLFCAAAALFLIGLFVCALITHIVALVVRSSEVLSGTDRTLGAGFGLVRGMLLVAMFILIAGTMGAAQERWWRDSAVLPKFAWLADGLGSVVPKTWLDLLKPTVTQQDAAEAPAAQPAAAQPGGADAAGPETGPAASDAHVDANRITLPPLASRVASLTGSLS